MDQEKGRARSSFKRLYIFVSSDVMALYKCCYYYYLLLCWYIFSSFWP